MFVQPTFTLRILLPGRVLIYIYSLCGHTKMHCEGHHCHFNWISIYICTIADAAIVLKCSGLYSVYSLLQLTFWSAWFQKRFIDPIKLSPLQLVLRLIRWSWRVATYSSTVVQAVISVVQATDAFRLSCSTRCLNPHWNAQSADCSDTLKDLIDAKPHDSTFISAAECGYRIISFFIHYLWLLIIQRVGKERLESITANTRQEEVYILGQVNRSSTNNQIYS